MTYTSVLLLVDALTSAIRENDTERVVELLSTIQKMVMLAKNELDLIERQLASLSIQAKEPTLITDSSVDPDQIRRTSRRTPQSRTEHSAVIPVWFGTNRIATENRPPNYSNERSTKLSFGRAEVFVPKAHRYGEIGSTFWTRLRRWDLRDDRLRVQHVEMLDPQRFWTAIKTEIDESGELGSARDALVFLPGFNVSFEEGAIRAAQIGFDLNFEGPMAFFSWPSQGRLTGYSADEASIEASEWAITEFLLAFVKKSGAQKVHVIAHSMGNRGLLRSLQRIAALSDDANSIRFGQVFLAAPDVDRDLFLDLAHLFPRFSERSTLYASGQDKAVHLSARLHGAPRAGYFLPHCIAKGIDLICVPYFDVDLLGHSYFAQAETLLNDMFVLLARNDPPTVRSGRIQRLLENGETFWEFLP